MTGSLPRIVASHKGLRPLGRQRHTNSPSRCLGVLLAVALFGADTFQPVIGLVEVTQGPKTKGKPAQPIGRHDGRADDRQQPVVISLQAWQWQQSCGELWPTFVFQPSINAGSGGSARSEIPGRGPAALPPVPLVWSLPAPAVVSWLSAPVDGAATLRVPWYRQILPIGPPVA